MCKILEDMRNEAAREAAQSNARETAKRFLKMGKLSFEEIAKGTGLTIEEIEKLEAEVMQLA